MQNGNIKHINEIISKLEDENKEWAPNKVILQ